MIVELSVSDARTKRRAIVVLQELGYRASSGAVRLAHPFSIEVHDVTERDVPTLRALVEGIDPTSTVVGADADATA